MYFTNAPFIFKGPFRVIKSFLAAETRARMHAVSLGLGRIVALHHRSFPSHRNR